MSIHIIYVGNTSTVELRGLITSVDREYANNALVTMSLETKTGEPVSGQTWPILLSYIEGSKGRYVGSFSHMTDLEADKEYVAVIKAVLPNGSEALWSETVITRERGKQAQIYV